MCGRTVSAVFIILAAESAGRERHRYTLTDAEFSELAQCRERSRPVKRNAVLF